jgi:hypothetical protein
MYSTWGEKYTKQYKYTENTKLKAERTKQEDTHKMNKLKKNAKRLIITQRAEDTKEIEMGK